MEQLGLFDNATEKVNAPPPTDRNVDPQDVPRLSGQNQQILRELLRGPCTNTQLAGIALKYTSRISDLRKKGYDIRNKRLQNGLTLYYLEKEKA